MKAKEYAEKLNSAGEGFEQTLKDLLTDLFKEGAELLRIRKVSTLDGLRGVFKELDMKWMAIVVRCPSIPMKDSGYKEAIRVLNPEVYEAVWGKNSSSSGALPSTTL